MRTLPHKDSPGDLSASDSPGTPPHITIAWTPAAVACVMLLGAKLWLIDRTNINWDEFNFLSHVFESTRGELRLLLQGAFVHLFHWLPMLDGNEADLVVTGRRVMWLLFTLTACLVWRLACVWVASPIALVSVVGYLSTLPVLKHGASFRYDSLIVPLIVACALLIARSGSRPRALLASAVLFGAAGALSIKSLLFAPLLGALILLPLPGTPAWSPRAAVVRLACFGALAILTAALLLMLHGLAVAPESHAPGSFARVALATMLLDMPLLPRSSVLSTMWHADVFFWSLLAAGFVCAVVQPRYRSASALLLALAPLVFYRNAWPYFYVVMLAPACILTAIAIETVARFLVAKSQRRGAELIVVTFVVAFAARGALNTAELRSDQQIVQRTVIEAVHQVFSTPVPYIDHSGMISSFPKANFFMSSWGVARYRDGGRSFMDEAIAHKPPLFMLLNRWELDVRGQGASVLLPRDRQMLLAHYLPYWGPIYVAGTELDLSDKAESAASLPFAGSYRLESDGPLIVNGVLREPGAVIEFPSPALLVSRASPDSAVRGRLVTSAARETRFLKTDLPMLQTSEGIYTGL